jgi:hypothetical protein
MKDSCRNNNNTHFPARAISKEQTEITMNELLECLKLVKTTTFAFFRIRNMGVLALLFITLSKKYMPIVVIA